MALNIYMSITGPDVKGQTTSEKFKDQIEILNVSQSVSQPIAMGGSSNQTRTGGKPDFSDLSFSKYVDMASTDLYNRCCSGQDYKKVIITMAQMDDSHMVPIWVITLENVVISTISMGAGSGDVPMENITFNFSKITWEFKKQETAGDKKGTKSAQWDLATVTAPAPTAS